MTMILNDFIHILSDAIQQHEGWLEGTGQAWPNLNPGNLHMEGQEGASGETGAEAKFASFFDGKQALNNDIAAKIAAGKNTITAIITEYESGDSSNDVPAYIAEVVSFFAARNIPIGADDDIETFMTALKNPITLVVVNRLFAPADWASIQAAIVLSATKMANYAFACRYSNIDLSKEIGSSTGNPTQTPYSVITAAGASICITPYNKGEVTNVMIYDGTIMQGHPTPAGGCEYQGATVNDEKVCAISSVIYEGPAFTDSLARCIVHELEHELSWLEEIEDTLHATLIAGQGYLANAWVDLEGYFTGNHLNTPAAVENLEAEKKSI